MNGSTNLSIEALAADGGAEWDAYVAAHPQSTLFHTLAWKRVIAAVFPHAHHYLVARRDGKVAGVFPLAFVKSILFGKSLVSVPFGVYGGVLADDDASARALLEEARAIGEKGGAKYVEMRSMKAAFADLPKSALYATFIADVPPTAEECLERIPRKARAEVRKALKDETLAFVNDVTVDDLFALFAHNKRSLGSPIFPKRLFETAARELAPNVHLHGVRKDGRIIAAVMSFVHRGVIMPYYSGTAPGAERHSASNFMYYKLMEWASANAMTKFDFGRSREGTGAYSFKKHQGFEPTPLEYEYLLVHSQSLPSLNPSNPKYDFAKTVFEKMPMGLAQCVGAWISKMAPF